MTEPNGNTNPDTPEDTEPTSTTKVAPDEVSEVVGEPDSEPDDNGTVELPNGDVLDYDDNGNTRRTDARTQSVYVANHDLHDVVIGLHTLYPEKF